MRPADALAQREWRAHGALALALARQVLALEDGAGRRGVVVTSDLLGFSKEVAEPICDRIVQKTGLKREQVLLTASHNHAGPVLALKPAADRPNAGEALRTAEYTRQLQEKVVESIAHRV